ncbi:BIGH3 [Mytilus edulis]|uniref:TGFBI n=1 Tax=Mytilus edulis TaxID=6550 RepID=A0A8S3TID1_MYTED|nr:BIGH3 [Mytilus edulis]
MSQLELLRSCVSEDKHSEVESLFSDKGLVETVCHLWENIWTEEEKLQAENDTKNRNEESKYYKLLFIEFNIKGHYDQVDSHRNFVQKAYNRLKDFVPNMLEDDAEKHDLSKYDFSQAIGYTVRWVHMIDNDAWKKSLDDHYKREHHHPQNFGQERMSQRFLEERPFTVFGPTDDAFAKLPPKVVKMLKEDKKLLADVLKFHVLSGKVYSSQLSNELTAPSLNPLAKVRINIYQGGKVITATGSPVVLPDQNATNGVIHVIDRVMFPLPLMPVTGLVGMDPKLSTLLTAVKAADLVQTLSGDGPFTFFAPTNDAFSKLPAGVLANLLKNKTALADVLTYHVVSGTFYSAGLTNGMSATTVEGKPVTITISGETTEDNHNTILTSDLPGKLTLTQQKHQKIPSQQLTEKFPSQQLVEDPNLLYDNKGKVKRPYQVETEIYQP